MTHHYIGTKQVTAWPEQHADGTPGYAVKYPDGYQSWSPAAPFEAAYFRLEESDNTRVTPDMVARFVKSIEFVGRHGNHAVYLVTLRNGFTLIEESACVTAENFDESIAREIVTKRVEKHVYFLLGFALAWARNGIHD